MRARLWPASAAAAAGILVGSAMVATRFVVDQTGPASLALLRYVVGFGCLLPPVLLVRQPARIARRDLLPIGLLGITQFGVLIALLNYGLRFVPAARAALIFATLPLLTLIVAAALGRERLTPAKIFGVLLTVAGVGLALGEKALQRDAAADEWWWWPKDFAYLRALGVHPAARGGGVGRALTIACIERARADGAAGIALNTLSMMPAATALYEGLGALVGGSG